MVGMDILSLKSMQSKLFGSIVNNFSRDYKKV
jgi:hypothetical protein